MIEKIMDIHNLIIITNSEIHKLLWQIKKRKM